LEKPLDLFPQLSDYPGVDQGKPKIGDRNMGFKKAFGFFTRIPQQVRVMGHALSIGVFSPPAQAG
jgi:hypothetical protein